jgi:hypothetical protein
MVDSTITECPEKKHFDGQDTSPSHIRCAPTLHGREVSCSAGGRHLSLAKLGGPCNRLNETCRARSVDDLTIGWRRFCLGNSSAGPTCSKSDRWKNVAAGNTGNSRKEEEGRGNKIREDKMPLVCFGRMRWIPGNRSFPTTQDSRLFPYT